MGHQFNPHNLLSMSLEVDRINQIKHLYPAEQQGLVLQREKKKMRLKQKRINEKDKPEGGRVRNQSQSDQEAAVSEDVKFDEDKGSNIDIKI
ncbi:MAG: hypothetical protein ACOCQ1_00315 [Halanaerobiaceae bacterium]